MNFQVSTKRLERLLIISLSKRSWYMQIKEAIKHLFVVSSLEHQEESSKENRRRIGEKRKLGESVSCFM